MPNLPSEFIAAMKKQLGEQYDAFEESLQQTVPTSVRVNALKNAQHHLDFDKKAKIGWHTEGYYLTERPVFTLDPAFHGGAYYVQEAGSMFIAEALTQVLDLDKDHTVLDLCAAPGGKTTLLTALFTPDSLILANEVIRSRVEVLKENVLKWGRANVYVSNHDSEDFAGLAGFFDVILIDAPCSGEGLFRKDPDAMKEWSEDAVQSCALRQKRILNNAARLVKPNGIMLYSTCTYNDFENENNSQWFAQTHGFEPVKINLNKDWRITEKDFGYQFYPHKTISEGFYLSILRKNKDSETLKIETNSFKKTTLKSGNVALPKKQVDLASKWLQSPDKFDFYQKPNGVIFITLKKHAAYITLINNVLHKKSSGLEIGSFKGQDFIPDHDLALSLERSEATPSVFLTKNQALAFLKKDPLELPDDAPQGWVLACYNGVGIGWIKVLKNRVNNYLPKDFRIRMDLPKDN